MCFAWPGPTAARPYVGPRAVEASPRAEEGLAIGVPSHEASEPSREPPPARPPPPRGVSKGIASPSTEERLPTVRVPVIDPMKQVRMRPVLDSTITVAAAAPSFALNLWVNRSLPASTPIPGTEPDVGRFDQLALGRFEEGRAIDIASDATVALSALLPVVYHAIEAGTRRHVPHGERGRTFGIAFGIDFVILAQALAINALATETLKAAVRRPRPYTYLTCADVPSDRCETLLEAQGAADANWSFPSGHTSHAFAATTAGATLLTLELLGRSKWGIAAAWIGGVGLASTTAALRVLAGKHFGSDVFTSALLGAGIGAAVPLAHWRIPRRTIQAMRDAPISTWSLVPMRGTAITGLALRGSLR